ncbi:MAG: DUF4124 domain-containing protein [Woeseiaceae bacterium]
MLIWTSLLALLLSGPLAASEIHKCVDADGGITFQQTPCPAPVEEPIPPEASPLPELEEDPVEPDTVVETEAALVVDPVAIEQHDPGDVETCKMPFRDAIDEIEAEMLRGYSAEQGEQFKQELHGLTEQMRACE